MPLRFSKLTILASVFLLLGLGSTRSASGVETGARPAAADAEVLQLSDVTAHRSPVLDLAALASEDADREHAGLPYRFALPDRVAITPQNSGTWEALAGGLELWRQRISCPDVLSLNLGFTRYYLPAGARLLVYAADGSGPVLSFDERDNKSHGQLWTPLFPTGELVVELVTDPEVRGRIDLVLGSIGRGYRDFGGTETDLEKSDYCEVDVICPEGDPWRDEIDTVGVFTLAGSWKCTGTLMNNTAQDGRPLFLTARHCDVVEVLAPSVVVYWNFQHPICGLAGGSSLNYYQTGSTFLAANLASDFTLIELDDLPDPALGVKYAGWDRSPADPDSAVCIHHPTTDEKSISIERDPTYTTTWAYRESPGDGTHIMVEDWDLGTTETGSSGSPLFNQDHRVVGQLHGGYASCYNDEPDWYGRLSVSWDGGGTPATRLSDHLDPIGSGVLVFPALSDLNVSGFDDWFPSGPVGGPFNQESRNIIVANSSDEDLDLNVAASVDWLDILPAEAEILAGQEVTVTLALNDLAAELAVGEHLATVTFTQSPGGGSNDFDLVLRVGGPAHLRIRSAAPNPFSSYVEVMFTLDAAAVYRAKFLDLRGRLVRDLGEFRGYWGANVVAWDGRGDSGRRMPAGAYVCQLEADGKEAQIRVMLIH